MERVRPWLEPFTWEVVTAQNAVLCQAKNALRKPTNEWWESCHREPIPLDEAVDFCRRCHRMAPFCFYNGNNFASIVGLIIRSLNLPADQAVVVRSLAGHIVAGAASEEEETAFREFCEGLS